MLALCPLDDCATGIVTAGLIARAQARRLNGRARSGLPSFRRDDLLRDAPEIWSSDVRLWAERIEDLPGSRDEGCGACRTERADDIPRMRCHESKSGSVGRAFSRPIVARGAAYADYDRDGDLGVLVTTNGGPAYLLRNDGGTGTTGSRFGRAV